ncbi:MAG: formamidopyrimidine-DNA glycosylase [Armatimonadetes bacterium]|nr:formamidopyrimidine-DNA glycosylase [Armatimonadota bacterium]
MPELPDVELYLASLRPRVQDQVLERIRLSAPFLLRSVDPPLSAAHGRRVVELRRLGKRIVLALEGDLFLLVHLMIAGRLRWRAPGAAVPGKLGLAALDFPAGTLLITEAGTRRRARMHLVQGEQELALHDPGGIEIASSTEEDFRRILSSHSHTLRRILTDPHLFAGIGGAYSDEILHRARLSPVKLSGKLSDEEVRRLHRASQAVLREWTERLQAEAGDDFPEKVTAFRSGMAVHGRFRKHCPDCGSAVQRITHGENETNYCPTCQTGGKLLADRSLSRLLRRDWPRSLDQLEEHLESRRKS